MVCALVKDEFHSCVNVGVTSKYPGVGERVQLRRSNFYLQLSNVNSHT